MRTVVERLLSEHPDQLKVTPGEMVYELQPRIDWDKGRAVVHLLEALHVNRDDVVPLYFGDDITDEHAFQALAARGIGTFVGVPDDPEVAGRTTGRLQPRIDRRGRAAARLAGAVNAKEPREQLHACL